ncbi:NAD(P)/FAD-dependent oxidoreductase [Myxococcota bacterium]|nr:NAD(P)/FAD-dependent oxidoreductase [Myxococcota bacterium]
MTSVVVVGGGPAGLAAAIWGDRLGLATDVLDAGERPGGQLLHLRSPIPDYPGFPDGTGPGLAEALAAHACRGSSRIHTRAEVVGIDVARREVVLADGRVFRGDGLLLAMGCEVRRLGVRGEERLGDRGVSWSAPQDAHRLRGQSAVVVGGGDSAFESALVLADACREVSLVHRGGAFRARADFVRPVLEHPRIRTSTRTEVLEIEGDGSVEAVRLRRLPGEVPFRVPCDAVFIRIGVRPRSELVAAQVALDAGGYVLVDHDQGVGIGAWAAGDLCTPEASSVSAAVGQAMVAMKRAQIRALSGA